MATDAPSTAQTPIETARSDKPPVPQVSIGMPVYNGEPFIREALDSLLAQTFTDFELIISDNASTDGTEAICREYAVKDARIRYVRQVENRGATANFQCVLDEAVGEYFMWAAADDVWAPDWVERLLSNFDCNFNTAAVIGKVGSIDSDGKQSGKQIKSYKHGDFLGYYLTSESRQKCMFMYALWHARTLRRIDISILSQVPYWSDAIFVYSALKYGTLFATHESTIFYRRHGLNTGKTAWVKFYDWRRLAYRAYPLAYHRAHYDYADGAFNKLKIFAAIPFKHVLEQVRIWIRGFRAITQHGPTHVINRVMNS